MTVIENPLLEGLQLRRRSEPCIVVIYGASGDLAQRKLMPALYALAVRRLLPERFAVVGAARPQAVGSQRLLEAAAQGEIHDKRLWTPIAAATGAGGNTTALVGTPEQVAEALLDYYDIGCTTLLIRGFEPLQDAIDYGRELIPLVRAEVARRERYG